MKYFCIFIAIVCTCKAELIFNFDGLEKIKNVSVDIRKNNNEGIKNVFGVDSAKIIKEFYIKNSVDSSVVVVTMLERQIFKSSNSLLLDLKRAFEKKKNINTRYFSNVIDSNDIGAFDSFWGVIQIKNGIEYVGSLDVFEYKGTKTNICVIISHNIKTLSNKRYKKIIEAFKKQAK